jgi:GTP-binding protein
MGVPKIAIVGRPNVGKSSLLNRLAGKRVSIVAPTPGVTRDRVTALVELDPPLESPPGSASTLVELVDTGGYGAYTAAGRRFDDIGADLTLLVPQIETQIRLAVEEAALVLFVVDAQAGLTTLDGTIATLLRKSGAARRVVVVANKVDGAKWVAQGQEASALGFGEPWCVSATTGFGVRELLDALHGRVRPGDAAAPSEEMRLAIVGKRNSGKSTLINTLAGEPRVIVSEIAGTTRDAVDVRFRIEGRTLLAIDTAGARKRKSVSDDVELYAYDRMLAAVARADVVLLLIDATAEVSQVDQRLASELLRRFKPVVITVNKWDLVEDRLKPQDYQEYLTERLRGLDFAPIAFVSAAANQGVREVIALAFNLFEQAGHVEPTAGLNRIVRSIVTRSGPSSRQGREARIYYAAQIGTHPPTIALVVNEPALFRGEYERYLLNRLHEELDCGEVPIRLLFRRRRRDEREAEDPVAHSAP